MGRPGEGMRGKRKEENEGEEMGEMGREIAPTVISKSRRLCLKYAYHFINCSMIDD